MSRDVAPGRPSRRSGALLLALVIGPLTLVACDTVGGGETLELDSAQLSIPGTAHEVRISGAGAIDSIAPATLEAEPGDAIRFVTDRRPHALTFTAESLAAPVREFLERTGQLRGPPLVNEGASWVVLLTDAPAGRYPFHCRSHDARGELIVRGDT